MRPGPLLVMDSGYPSIGGGGCESQCGTLGRWFAGQGYNVQLVVPHDEYTPPVPYEVIDGLPVRRILYRPIKLLGTLSLHVQVAWEIWRRRHDTTAIYMHIANWLAVTVCLVGRLTGLPVLIKLTGQTELAGGVLDPNGGFTARLKRAGIRLANGYQAISEEIRDRLLRVGMPEDKVYHIGNAVDTSRFVNQPKNLAAREAYCPGASFVMLFVGRLEPVKNLLTLLDAWAEALGADQSAWLVLAGDGSLREELEQRAGELDIADRVLFLGEVPDVSALTNWADVGVLPSYTEGLSNAMLECLAAGLPMLASRVGGNPDFVRDGETGWLFDPTDRGHLTRLLTTARDMPVEERVEMARRARKLIESEIALDTVGNRLARLLQCDPPVESVRDVPGPASA